MDELLKVIMAVCISVLLLMILLTLIDIKEAVSAEPQHAVIEINCKDVPDSLVKSGYDTFPLYGYDEWGNGIVVIKAKELECPEGTRKRYPQPMIILASNPEMIECECWTVKTVCDTVYAKEE